MHNGGCTVRGQPDQPIPFLQLSEIHTFQGFATRYNTFKPLIIIIIICTSGFQPKAISCFCHRLSIFFNLL